MGGTESAPMPVVLPEEELLFHLLGRFIRVRWLFVASLGMAILVGALVLKVEFPVLQTAVVGAVVLAYNILFSVSHALRRARVPNLKVSRLEAGLQIGLDLLALTALVHYLGGAESPFMLLYLIHAIAGGMLLSNKEAWLVMAAAFALFLAVVVLEHQQVLPHYHPTGPLTASTPPQLQFDVAVCLAFLATLVISVSITTWTMDSLRRREQQLVEIQTALVKNGADLKDAYASLAQKQHLLVQTEKQASLGKLVAGIAHEINNPIQFIHGNMGVLSESLLDVLPILDEHSATHPGLRIARLDYPFFREQVPTLLGDMANGASRIRAIVRDLRTFARREESALDEVVDLTETVHASVRLLNNQLKHLRVELDLEPTLPALRGNLTQLQQVVLNALQNACQAMRPGAEGRIRVRARAEQGGAWVRLSVEDNGCGIAPEVRDRIFDPFFTTKQRSEGTGLGLAISLGIVQRHQGRIDVESLVGQGTTFHFLLPVKRDGAV